SGFRLEVSGGNRHELLWVNVLAQGRVDLVGRERCDLLLEVGLPNHGAVKVAQSRERASESGVTGAADLTRLEVALASLVQFVCGNTVPEQERELVLHAFFQLGDVLWIDDGRDVQARALVLR